MPHSKKVLAAAVAGALSMPAAVALAQTSTVQISGGITLLYYQADPKNPSSAKKGDILETSEPRLRVSGQEKLGGGLAVWFQCESSLDGITQGASGAKGLCARNSALGMKGSWGNVFFGNWDMPARYVNSISRIGWFSNTNALYGGGGRLLENGSASGSLPPVQYLRVSASTGGAVVGTAQSQNATAFSRRSGQSINYHSPVFSGFQVLAAYTATNQTTGLPEASPLKPRIFGVSGLYKSGPLQIGVGYEQHKDFNPGNTTVGSGASQYGGGTDTSWDIAARYTFAGQFRIGGRYVQNKYEASNTGDLKSKGWYLAGSWRIQGPHTILAQYDTVDDPTGSTSMTVGSYRTSATAGGLATGAKHYTLAYTYDLSKRTQVGFAYNRVENDAGTKGFSLGKTAATVGGKQTNVGVLMKHSF